MNNNYYIYGASGHGLVIADILEKMRENILGFVDDDINKKDSMFNSYKIIGGFEDLIKIYSPEDKVILAIGINKTRKRIVESLSMKNIEFGNAVHPSAQIGKNVIIGSGTVVMANSVINADTVVGEHCIINTSSSIDHENKIGNFVHISPGVTTGGLVNIGDLTWIGLGAKIINCINIGQNNIIGAGTVVIENIENNSVYVGNPAKYLKENK